MSRHILLVASISILLSGCGPQNTTHEILGNTAERVAGVSRVIESNIELPTEIIDARLIEMQYGDGQLGPSDYRSFLWIKVRPDDIARWQAVMKSSPDSTSIYDAPPTQPNWWLSETTYDQLAKYDSRAIFNRHGWITIDPDGNIFALTYTL